MHLNDHRHFIYIVKVRPPEQVYKNKPHSARAGDPPMDKNEEDLDNNLLISLTRVPLTDVVLYLSQGTAQNKWIKTESTLPKTRAAFIQ